MLVSFHSLLIQALLQALGDRKGINRFGDFSAPLDESLIHVALVHPENYLFLEEEPVMLSFSFVMYRYCGDLKFI